MGFSTSGDPPAAAVASADATTNVTIADVIGNKSDAGLSTIGTTASLMRYTKGILSTSVETGAVSVDPIVSGAYTQLVASSAAAIKAITLSGDFYNVLADVTVTFEIGTGAGGSEVVVATNRARMTSLLNMDFVNLTVKINRASGTRVAIRPTTSSGTPSMYMGYVIEEL